MIERNVAGPSSAKCFMPLACAEAPDCKPQPRYPHNRHVMWLPMMDKPRELQLHRVRNRQSLELVKLCAQDDVALE